MATKAKRSAPRKPKAEVASTPVSEEKKVSPSSKNELVVDGVTFDVSKIPASERKFVRANVVLDEKGKPHHATLRTKSWRKFWVYLDGSVEEVSGLRVDVQVKRKP